MQAGPEMDALVAQAMGYKCLRWPAVGESVLVEFGGPPSVRWCPSVEWSDARLAIEWLGRDGRHVTIQLWPDGVALRWDVSVVILGQVWRAVGETLPLAACRAVVKVAEALAQPGGVRG